MSKSTLRMIAACVLLAPLGALASPITINFTITATKTISTDGVFTPGGSYGGFPTGAVGGGSFTFDDTIGTGFDLTTGLPTLDLDFTWLGKSFTEANATLWNAVFDSTGTLTSWGFGRRGVESSCLLNCVSTIGPTDFTISGYGFAADDAGFMHLDGVDGTMFGAVTWSVAPRAVPEPSTLGLFALSLLGLGLVSRRRTS